MLKNLYLIVGRSGVGKTTITEALRDRYGYQPVCSYTDRPKRTETEDNHIFVTPEEFDTLGEMLAYTEFNGHRYGATQELVDQSDLYVIDPDGLCYMLEKYKSPRKVYTIGLNAPKHILEARMLARGDSLDAVKARLSHDDEKFQNLRLICDTVIPNIDFAETVQAVAEYINRHER